MNPTAALPHFRRPLYDPETGETNGRIWGYGPAEPGTIELQGSLFGEAEPVVRFVRDGAIYLAAECRRVPVPLDLFQETTP